MTGGRQGRGVKRSVALAIRAEPREGARGAHADYVLLVQRPRDDEDLPNVWGLPAASLREGEVWPEAARRAALDKLGVDVAIGEELARGLQRRGRDVIEMRVFDATIAGSPSVPQPMDGVTQYIAWRWGEPAVLEPGAERGSLCCRLYLDVTGSNSRAGLADRPGEP